MNTETEHETVPRHAAKPELFFGPDGKPLPSWLVPLADYVEGHEGYPGNWARVHMIVVARALVHDHPVPAEVLAGHDPLRLQATVERERIFHDQARHLCRECNPVQEEEGS